MLTRVVLVIAALLVLVGAGILRYVEVETSITTEITSVVPSASPAATAATDSPASAPRPTALQTSQVKTTRVDSTAGDTLVVALLGAAGVLLLFAAFGGRLSEFGLFGASFKLSPEDRQRVTRAVARRARHLAAVFAERADAEPALLQLAAAPARASGPLRLMVMARGQQHLWPEILEAHSRMADQTAAATARAMSDAETLLVIGHTAPDSLRAFAQPWDLTEEDLQALRAGELPDGVLDKVADRALDLERAHPVLEGLSHSQDGQ